MNQTSIKIYSYRWVALTVFSLAQIGIQFFWATFLPITGEVAEFYSVTPLAIGFLSMMFMLVYIFVSLPSSWAITNFGVHKAVGFATILMGLSGLVRGLLGDAYAIVLVCTVPLAIAQPFIINAITTMSARWFPVDERATATGLAMLAQLAGIMGGMAITPWLVAAVGLKTTLIIYGIIGVVVCILFLLIYREHPPTPVALMEAHEEPPLIRQGLRLVLSNKDAVLLLIIFCGGMVAFNSVSTWIEQVLSPRGFNSIQAGTLGGVMILGGISGCIVLPLLSDKSGKRRVFILLGTVAIVPGLLVLTFTESLPLMLVFGGVLGFFQLGLGPIIMEAAAQVCRPATEATTQGVLWMLGQGLSVAGIFLMDHFRMASGAMTPFMLVFVVLISMNLLFAMLLNESRLINR